MLAHAVLLAEARTYVAALADYAVSLDAALEYERVLLQVDALHQGRVPPITTAAPTDDQEILYDIARIAIGNLINHGLRSNDVQLCLAMLQAAHELQLPR